MVDIKKKKTAKGVRNGVRMSAMSQIMDATYCIGGDMDFGRMFDQYLHKVSGRIIG